MPGGWSFPDGAAIVFGGSGGIGSVVAETLAQAGSAVAVVFRSNAARADEVVRRIVQGGGKAAAFAADVTDRAGLDTVVEAAVARFGRVHTMVFGAGSLPAQTYLSTCVNAAWHDAINVEVHGFFNAVRAVLPALKAGGGGSIVHLGSAGEVAWPIRDGLSVVPKAANEALVRGIAREEGRFGIRANSVLIGVIEAGMFLKFRDEGVFDEAWVRNTHRRLALKRLGKPEDVADAVVFLASSRAGYVTGQQLAVSGGYGI